MKELNQKLNYMIYIKDLNNIYFQNKLIISLKKVKVKKKI